MLNSIKMIVMVLVIGFVVNTGLATIVEPIIITPIPTKGGGGGGGSGHPAYYQPQELSQALSVFGVNVYMDGRNEEEGVSLYVNGRIEQGINNVYYGFQRMESSFYLHTSEDNYSKFGEESFESTTRFEWSGSIDFIIRNSLPENPLVNYQGDHNFNALGINEHSYSNARNYVDWKYVGEDNWEPVLTNDYEFSFHSYLGAENSPLFFPVLESISINTYQWDWTHWVNDIPYETQMLNLQFSADGHFSQVPEPMTLCLLGIGGLGMILRKRKREKSY